MTLGRLPRTFTLGRVWAIEIRVNWRWLPVLALGTWLLAQNVLPTGFPAWALGTHWLTAAAVVLAGEGGLLLHELSHALVARRRGQHVLRIVFYGFRAQTVVGAGPSTPAHEATIALAGPAMNLALAGLAALMRFGLATQGPVDVLLLSLVLGNAAMAAMSLAPLSGSDGGRALSALWRARAALETEIAGQRHDHHDHNQYSQRRPAGIPQAPRMAEATSE